ncbi:hypothetical protein GQ600_27832 [Phytophthora cactorum]|nr:hypothetical protein GQ600_27832 [Phytophthora cactorum]
MANVLLVSECEADHILELLWSARGDSTACSFSFVNLAFACESLDRGDGSTKFHETHLALGSSLDQDLPLLSHEAIATMDKVVPARALLPHGPGRLPVKTITWPLDEYCS